MNVDQPVNVQRRVAGNANRCYHCAEPLRSGSSDESVRFDEKEFCCQGCKMVYEILQSNNLCAYYEIDEKAGINLKGRKTEIYAYLDDSDLISKLIDFSDGKMSRVTFHLPQMHCASCIWLLENLYKLNPAIKQSRVNFLRKEVYISFDETSTSLRQVVELLASIGYAPAINLHSISEPKKKSVDRRFIYKIGVAGFAFGNIMLLSFPEYLGLNPTDHFFQQVFGYLNILLSIPVVFFSGFDYLTSAWTSLRNRYLNLDVPIALGIVALFGRSVYEILTHTGAGYLDSLAGLIFFLLIGKWFQQKTYYHLSFERDYKSYFPVAATVKTDGKEQTRSLDKLELGDVILVRNRELIPADGILIRGRGNIDYSFVSGESEPVNRQNGEPVYAGGRQMGEAIEISLTRKVSQSYLTQLWNDEAFAVKTKAQTSRLADLIGRRFTFVVLTISIATLVYWLPRDAGTAFNAFTAVLIIACPCAVALSIPFTLGNIIRLLGRAHFYVKNTKVIEDFNLIDTVVFDKTGTITHASESKVVAEGAELSTADKCFVRSLAGQSNHPLSRQLYDFLHDGTPDVQVSEYKEHTGQGIEGRVGGKFIRFGSAKFLNIESQQKDIQVWVELDGKLLTGFRFLNNYREGLPFLINYFQKKYTCFLLSGDNDREKENLLPLFKKSDALLFNQSPQDKLEFIRQLQSKGKRVLMIGDGLNDAGALQSSDIGIVVTENTNNFTPACDAILRADKFQKLPFYVDMAKGGTRLVHYAYFLAFCYNVVGLSYAVSGTLSPVVAAILMPASSVTIVLFGVGSSAWLAWRKGLK